MRTHAAEIAEKLQGAHERRTGKRREDEDMKDESVWVTKAEQDVANLAHALAAIREAMESRTPGEPQASAVSAERVVELERANEDLSDRNAALERDVAAGLARQRELQDSLTKAREGQNSGSNAYKELERKLMDTLVRVETAEADAKAVNELLATAYVAREADAKAVNELLATAYVAREVPWTDVAAGMMTIARDGTPWMVQFRDEDGGVGLRNGEQTFDKNPADGETVHVLVPYVTDEQAEGLVRDVLGGTEVGS